MNKIIILILFAGFFTGCVTGLAAIKSECDSYGFTAGTDAHSNCILSFKQESQRRSAHRWQNLNNHFKNDKNARIQANQNIKNSIGSQRNSYRCTSRGNGVTGPWTEVITECQ